MANQATVHATGKALMDYERHLRAIAASLVPTVAAMGTPEANDAIRDLILGGDPSPVQNPYFTGTDLETQLKNELAHLQGRNVA